MDRILLILLTGFAFAKPVLAQLNESDSVRFQFRVSLTGNYQQGNLNLLTARSKLDFTCSLSPRWVFKSQNSGLYQRFGTQKADDDFFSRNWLYYKPHQPLYPYIISFISVNYRRKIDHRYFAGAGITWQPINTQSNVLKLSVNTVYEKTGFSNRFYNFSRYNGKSSIQLWRGALYTAGWNYLLQRKLRVYYDAYWQPAFTDRNNYRTQFDIGVDCPVWKGLAFTALYSFTHENIVVENIKPDDSILSFGLSYNFRKNDIKKEF